MRLTLAAAAATVLAALAGCATTPVADTSDPALTPRNIIFFLGDGLGVNTLTAARIYAVGETGELTLDTLPESAWIKTFSHDGQVTDSAASMSAYMTGKKVNNGVLSMSTDTIAAPTGTPCTTGSAAPTLGELARARGMSVGVVTTTRVTDATPAAVFAHVCNRTMEPEIAASLVPGGAGYNQALGPNGLDVLLGGGTDFFAARRTDQRDLLAELAAKGHRIVTDSAQLAAADSATAAPLVGLFAAGDLDYDAVRDAARQPALSTMAVKAIDVLAKNPKGFFLMVEGGLIDLALHDTQAKRALQETVAFDTALKAAIARMRVLDPGLKNTLIVATADHDHTLLLNGYSRRTGKTTATEPGVLGLIHKVDDGKARLDLDGAPMTIIGFGTGQNRVQGSRGSVPALTDAQVSADGYRQEAVVRSHPGDETHSGTDVYLGAVGAGAGRFGSTIDNTRVFELIKAAAGL